MACADGRLVRASAPVYPCEASLFQVQERELFKVFSRAGDAFLIGAFNLADADAVSGSVSPSDAKGLTAKKVAFYEYFSGEMQIVEPGRKIPVALPRMGYKLYYAVPYDGGFAAFGLVDKYIAPASISSCRNDGHTVSLSLYEGGKFACAVERRPAKMTLNGAECPFEYSADGLLTAQVEGFPDCRITITLAK